MKGSIVDRVKDLVESSLDPLGLELVDVAYVKEGEYWYVRVFIDKEKGVDLDDCAEVSRQLSSNLDTANLITHAYMLEVSSPGIERPLKKRSDYERFQGSLVSIETTEKIQGFTHFNGYLAGLDDQGIDLTFEKEEIRIHWSVIREAHLAVAF